MSRTERYTLKAMAENYSEGHLWDHLDSKVCVRAAAEIERYDEALTPSGETKAEYIGEFQFTITAIGLDESDKPYEYQDTVTVPWTTIKEIMAAIRDRATRNNEPRSGERPLQRGF